VSKIPERIGDYRVLGLLGRGGMGTVYRATRDSGEGDRGDAEEVALKVLAAGMAEDASTLRRFELELDVLSRLDHPGVTRALGPMEREGGHVYFPMEYVRGPTLRALLDSTGALPLDRAVAIARKIFDALAAAHGVGVVHRDVKPSNVLVVDDDGRDDVKVADFGLARLVDATRVTATGLVMGTLDYMSPEQCEGARVVDARADIYATGVVLYEMLAGAPPFKADTPVALLREHIVTPPPPIERVRPDVPPELARFLADCLAKRPDDRLASSRTAVERLDALPALGNSLRLVAPPADAELQTRVEMQHTSPAAGAPTATAIQPSGESAGSTWPRRVALALVAVALVAAVWVIGHRAGRRDPGPQSDPATALWTRLRSSIATSDYDTFLTCFTPELRTKLGSGDEARRRFEYAVDDLVEADLRTGKVSGNLAGGHLKIQVMGSALPTAIGMPVEAATGLQVDVERADGGWQIADARPTKTMKQPGGDPVARAANRAVLSLSQVDRLARTLNEAQDDQLTREQRRGLSEWLDEVRASGVPPNMAFVLDPERYDAERRIWKVDVVFRSLAEKLGAPDTRLALVLGPSAGARGTRPERGGPKPRDGRKGRDTMRLRIVEARLLVR